MRGSMMCSFHLVLKSRATQSGFSLLEMAVVMVILGLLLGGLLGPLSVQRDSKNQNDINQRLLEIENALMGFASINGYLPCPARANSNGLEARNGANNCTQQHGFVPTVSLGLQGAVDGNMRMLDPWLVPIRYSLSSVNNWEYAKAIQLNVTAGDYRICAQATCTNILAQNIAAVVYSLGEFGNQGSSSPDQLENTDNDTDFVSRTRAEGTTTEFNDTLRWISPNILVFQLVKSGQL